ncbi:MAG: FtsW/RodA/SpoVE family cell cycle protein, partial [Opitutaceae bacterium]|nr:FtsW/RodA/SpoVE family cell cycle protein [Opitutaceae bacterium]
MSRSSFSYEHSRFDLISPFCIIALSIIGVFFIYSAQHYHPNNDWIKQIIWAGVGLTAYFTVSLIDYKIFLKFSHWVYFLALGLLALVAWSPLGVTILGAKRWLDVGVTTVQPSELAKLACLVIGASMLTLSEVGTVMDSRQTLAKMALAVSLPFLFILFQPDLGSALVIPFVVFAQLYASNLSKSFFTTALAIFAVLVGLVVLDTHNYGEYMAAKAETTEEQVVERPHY